jgi:hypothetical protein
VEALAGIRLEECLVRLLIVPGLVRLASLHRAQDAHQTRPVAALGEDLLYDGLLADGALADELDLDPAFLCKLFGVAPDPTALGVFVPFIDFN